VARHGHSSWLVARNSGHLVLLLPRSANSSVLTVSPFSLSDTRGIPFVFPGLPTHGSRMPKILGNIPLSLYITLGCPHWATVKAAGKFLQFTEDCNGRRYAYSILSLLPFLRQIQRSSGPCAKPSVCLSPTHSSVCLVWSSGLGPRRSGRGRTTTPTRNTRRT
jgi:hypothetical protein